LIDLTMPGNLTGAAARPIQSLATYKLRELNDKIESVVEHANSKIDPYTVAHLTDAQLRIEKALDAQYIYNASDIGSRGGMQRFGQPAGR